MEPENITTSRSRPPALRGWWGVGLVLFLALLTCLWFGFFPYRTFMGDDLSLMVSLRAIPAGRGIAHALTAVGANKYRPVCLLFTHLAHRFLGDNFTAYYLLNLGMEWLNACLVAWLAYRLSRRQRFTAWAAGSMFIFSRFSYYNVYQVLGGVLEGLALTWFLLLVIATQRAYAQRTLRAWIGPVTFYLLAVFTHERYVVLGGFLTAAIWLAPATFRTVGPRLLTAAMPSAVLLLNYTLKTQVFKINFYETGGGVSVPFDIRRVVHFLLTGGLNLLGFNVGPDYLSGVHVAAAGHTGWVVGGLLTAALASLVVAYLFHPDRALPRRPGEEARNLFLLLVLGTVLLLSAAVSFHQEYRWLYAPYVVLLLGAAYLSGRLAPAGQLRGLLMAGVLVAAGSVDLFYRGYLDRVYFIDSQKIAHSARSVILDKYGPELARRHVVIIGAPTVVRKWIFLDRTFFTFYTGAPGLRVQYVDDFQHLTPAAGAVTNLLVFAYNPMQRAFVDITPQARSALVSRAAASWSPRLDFLAERQRGKVHAVAGPDPAAGSGVLFMDWMGELGVEPTMTVINGFTCTFGNITLQADDVLSFKVGMPLLVGDGTMAYVDITAADGRRQRLWLASLLPADATGIRWASVCIPCRAYAGQVVALTFGVQSPTVDLDGDWVAFSSVLLGPLRKPGRPASQGLTGP